MRTFPSRRHKAIIFGLTALAIVVGKPAYSSLSFGENLASSVLESVIGAFIHVGVKSLFDDDDLDVEDIKKELNRSFYSFRFDDIKNRVSDLADGVGEYASDVSVDERNRKIDKILDLSTHAKNGIDLLMPDHFWDVIGYYMVVQSTHFAFLMESGLINNSEQTIAKVPKEAAEALGKVEDYFTHYMRDKTHRRCIRKSDDQKWFNKHGQDIPAHWSWGRRTHPVSIVPTSVGNTYCEDTRKHLGKSYVVDGNHHAVGEQYQLKLDFFKSKIPFKNPKTGQLYFTMRHRHYGDEGIFKLHGPYQGSHIARRHFLTHAIFDYQNKTGKIAGYLRSWLTIARSSKEKAIVLEAESSAGMFSIK